MNIGIVSKHISCAMLVISMINYGYAVTIKDNLNNNNRKDSNEDKETNWIPVLNSDGRELRRSNRYINLENEETQIIDDDSGEFIRKQPSAPVLQQDVHPERDHINSPVNQLPIQIIMPERIVEVPVIKIQKVYLTKRDKKAIRKAWRAQKRKERRERRLARKYHKNRIKRVWKKIF